MSKNLQIVAIAAIVLTSLGQRLCAAAEETRAEENSTELKIVTFQVDVTPPIGDPLAYVPNDKVETPIYVSGIVLDDGQTRAVWVSCDYIYICGESYVVWTEAIAKNAGTVTDNVFLHSVHQHDSIRWAPEYNPKDGEDGPMVVNPVYCAKSLSDVSEAIAGEVTGPWQTVGRLMTGETRIGGLAANRRLVDENGQFAHTRSFHLTGKFSQVWYVNLHELRLIFCALAGETLLDCSRFDHVRLVLQRNTPIPF